MEEYKKQRLEKSKLELTKLIGRREYLNQNEYRIYNTLLLGYVPNDCEIDMIFGESGVLERCYIEKLISNKIANERNDFHILEIFRAFDIDFKGFIDTSDLLRASKCATPHFSRQVLLESFNELSPLGNLGYETFKNICLKCD